MGNGDVTYRSQGRRVLTAGGTRWCVALAYTGQGDGLPITTRRDLSTAEGGVGDGQATGVET